MENRGAHNQKDMVDDHHTRRHRANQPNAPNGDISDSHAPLSPQAQLGVGMNDSQVALHTGQAVKVALSIPVEEREKIPKSYHY